MAKFVYCDLCGKKVMELKKGSLIQKGCKVQCRECSERLESDYKNLGDTPDFMQDLFKQFGGNK